MNSTDTNTNAVPKADQQQGADQGQSGTAPNTAANHRRICLSCGQREEADGSLACGH